MRAVQVGPDRALRVGEVPEPSLGRDEVRVGVSFCGVCGSDLHMRGAGMLPPGAVMGHEFSGTIVEVGPEVEGWTNGERVAVFPFEICGRCGMCADGRENLCLLAGATAVGLGAKPGALAERCVVRPSMLHRLPDELSAEGGALVEPLAVALHGVAVSEAHAEAPAAVIGAGPIGVMTALGLRALGFEHIAVIERNERRSAQAERLGFRVFQAERMHADVPGAFGGDQPVTVFECTGNPAVPQAAIDLVRPGGVVVSLGVTEQPVTISQLTMMIREAQLRTSFSYRPAEFDRAIELLSDGRVPIENVVTRAAPLEEAEAVFDDLASPDTSHVKVLLHP